MAKLIIKRFVKHVPNTESDTSWWIYLVKDGKGHAIRGLWKYPAARAERLGYLQCNDEQLERMARTLIVGNGYEEARTIDL